MSYHGTPLYLEIYPGNQTNESTPLPFTDAPPRDRSGEGEEEGIIFSLCLAPLFCLSRLQLLLPTLPAFYPILFQVISLQGSAFVVAVAVVVVVDIYIQYIIFSSHLLSSRPSCSVSLLVVTQIRGHIAGSSPPLPTTVRALHFIERKIQLFLPSSTRVKLCLPTLGDLSS